MRLKKVADCGSKLMQGNEACAAAALAADCKFMAGYPITPATEIPEYLSSKMFAEGGVCLLYTSRWSGRAPRRRCPDSNVACWFCCRT